MNIYNHKLGIGEKNILAIAECGHLKPMVQTIVLILAFLTANQIAIAQNGSFQFIPASNRAKAPSPFQSKRLKSAFDTQIEAKRALIKVVDSTNIPALQEGPIRTMDVRLGKIVQRGQLIAEIDDHKAASRLDKISVDHAIAVRQSKDNTLVEFARKALEVSKSELQRAVSANSEVDLAVSQSEVDRLQLVVEKNRLEVDKATIDLDVLKLTEKMRLIEKTQAARQLEEFKIRSPCDGLVVQVDKQVGEWVEPGTTIARVVRIDVLRVEGQIPVEHASLKLKQAKVSVVAQLSPNQSIEKQGEIIFVSLEANPVDKLVRVVAEIRNEDLTFRPGLPVKMSIKLPVALEE